MVFLLDELGLSAGPRRVAVQLEAAWEFRRWQDGRVIVVQPMGEACLQLYEGHCYVAHRADLLALLQQALPAAQLKQDHRCPGHQPTDRGVQITFTHRHGGPSEVQADVLVGADGIHSVIRSAVASQEEARFSGLCAFRCLVPVEPAPAMALRPVQTLWLGTGRRWVHYPISAGRLVNIVAIVPGGDWRAESWTAEGLVADMQAAFEGWAPPVQHLLAAAIDTRRWALVDRSPLPRWSKGRVTLLGDATHADASVFAQGAAQAVDEAAVLSDCLTGAASDAVTQTLQRYETGRLPRASQVQLMRRGLEIRNHLPDGP